MSKVDVLASTGKFGPDAQGENMWVGQTWENILLEIKANSSEEACESDTY